MERKLAIFTDSQGNTLEFGPTNFGYHGGTPGDLVDLLVKEGFNPTLVEHKVFNRASNETYPLTIQR